MKHPLQCVRIMADYSSESAECCDCTISERKSFFESAKTRYEQKFLSNVFILIFVFVFEFIEMFCKMYFQYIPNQIVSICATGQRVFVSDVQESVYMVRYKRQENQLIIFADDTHPRWITCTTILDYDTVATADKFGNIAIVSLIGVLITLWKFL